VTTKAGVLGEVEDNYVINFAQFMVHLRNFSILWLALERGKMKLRKNKNYGHG
jgi:hypothetical protein